ncbi:hypothetical protein HLPCO_002524 [Haloplasma contractile SSD-17B]|uniref:Uncharacterized protein n=1 Tax=Haloplasma contractile SSD-17B TaxID=1033810 RepID=U2DS78_9MOLU|nr:hypothetical protein HLPCO_002524 [Haloplasma contractile SSD-17B]
MGVVRVMNSLMRFELFLKEASVALRNRTIYYFI